MGSCRPFNRGEYERWMAQAKRTFSSAEEDARAGYFEWACFKAQQSAEYAVKGLLRGLGHVAVGHSITRLLRLLAREGVEVPEEVLDAAMELDRHYMAPRYPNVYHEGPPFEYYSERIAERVLGYARVILSFVEEVVGRWRS